VIQVMFLFCKLDLYEQCIKKTCNFSEDNMEKVQSLLDTASGVLGFGGDPFATLVGSKVLNI